MFLKSVLIFEILSVVNHQTRLLKNSKSQFSSLKSLIFKVYKRVMTVFAGQAVGGIFPALVDLLVTLVRVPEQDVGFACFTIATVVLVKQSQSSKKFIESILLNLIVVSNIDVHGLKIQGPVVLDVFSQISGSRSMIL